MTTYKFTVSAMLALALVIGTCTIARAESITSICASPTIPLSVFVADTSGYPSGMSVPQSERVFTAAGFSISSAADAPVILESDEVIYRGQGAQADPITQAMGFHNVIIQSGGYPVSFTMHFKRPILALAIRRAALFAAQTGTTSAPWTAIAYGRGGAAVATVNEDEIRSYETVPGQNYLLHGASRFSYVTFTGNDHGFDGYTNVVISDLAWCL